MGIMYKLMKHRNLTMDLNTKPSAKTKSDKCRLLAMDAGHKNDSDVRGNDDDDYPPPTTTRKMEGEMEKRFTAEHILQLCKFLAEKSKRNKNLHKQQQSPKKLTKTQKTFQFQPMDYNDDINDKDDDSDNFDNDDMVYDNEHHHDYDNDVVGVYQNQGLPLLSNPKPQHNKHCEDPQMMANAVLSSRLSPDINALNISTSALQQQQQNNQQYQRLQQQHNLEQDHQQQQHQHQQQQHHCHQQGKRDILLKIRHQIFERKRLREKGYEPQVLNATASQVWRPW